MLTKEVSQKFLLDALLIHRMRAKCLFETSWSLVNHARLTVTNLGVHRHGNSHVKHKIKSVDRLLSNKNLHAEIPLIYKRCFAGFMATKPELYIIVDWSGCCSPDNHMLRASLVHNGRSISIYNEVHPQEKLGNRVIQTEFLQRLHQQLPRDKRVIIITDAGYATPWFRAVRRHGWHFIGRLRGGTHIQLNGETTWRPVRELHKKASHFGHYLGKAKIAKKSASSLVGNMYRYKQPKKNRKDRSRYPEHNQQHSKAHRTPWIIVTSLPNAVGKAFVKGIYEQRMQIEQTFRDQKSQRFGFGWRLGRTTGIQRISVLCLIAAIAFFFLITLGILAEKLNLQKHYQVNTVKKKRVLSLITLARQIMIHGPPIQLVRSYQSAYRKMAQSYEHLYGGAK